MPLDGVLAANHRDTHRNTKDKTGLPLDGVLAANHRDTHRNTK